MNCVSLCVAKVSWHQLLLGLTCVYSRHSGVPCRGVSSNDFPCLENLCKKIIKEKQPFERLEIKKETLLEMFKVPTDQL